MTNDHPLTICFTGHRILPRETLARLPQLLEEVLTALVLDGDTIFRAGGALGFDTLATLKVLELKARFPQTQLHLYLPCRDQDKYWNDDEKALYKQILQRADAIHYTTEQYVDGCMLQRNREMIDGCDICVAFFRGQGGGTAYSYHYAQQRGLQIINLSDFLNQERSSCDDLS